MQSGMHMATSYLFIGFSFYMEIAPFKKVSLSLVFSSVTEGTQRIMLWTKHRGRPPIGGPLLPDPHSPGPIQ